IPLISVLLKVTRACDQSLCTRIHLAVAAPTLGTPRITLAARPPSPRSRLAPPRPAPPLQPPNQSASYFGCLPGSGRTRSCLHSSVASQAHCSQLSVRSERGLESALVMNGLKGPQAGERRRGDGQLPSLGPRMQLDPASSRTLALIVHSLGPEFCMSEILRYEPKNRQNGRLLVFDPNGKLFITSNVKCLYGRRPRLASKHYTSQTQVSQSVAKTFSEKKKVSSKKIENKVSLKNAEKRVSSKNIKNKDFLTNVQSDQWPSSFLKESTGEEGKDTIIAKQEKNNEHCVQGIDKLSESTDADGEDDTSDEDDEDSNPKKDTRAPLELMAEFLRAEMGRDYHLAKKLCQMILIYEPENPEAKEFLSLIEEMLLMEKAQNLKEDEEDSEEDSSGESEGESSEDLSDESSDECEDGS
uniref:Glutamate rich 2 n=1 Tax=Ictidomys tridecemlineatus TaxID=43179 RepID=A0A287CX12_ICTTR